MLFPNPKRGKILALDIDNTLIRNAKKPIQLYLVESLLKKFHREGGLIILLTHGSTFFEEEDDDRYPILVELFKRIGIPEADILYLDLTYTADFCSDTQKYLKTREEYLRFLENMQLKPNYFDQCIGTPDEDLAFCDSNKLNLLLFGLFTVYQKNFYNWLSRFCSAGRADVSCMLVDDQPLHIDRFTHQKSRIIQLAGDKSIMLQMDFSGALVKEPGLFNLSKEMVPNTQCIKGYFFWSEQSLINHYLFMIAEFVGIHREICEHALLTGRPLSQEAWHFLLAAYAAHPRILASRSPESASSESSICSFPNTKI